MMRSMRLITGFLGISMFLFGILKFVKPFKTWYTVQIENSGLGTFSFAIGIAAEIFVGLVLLWGLYNYSKIPMDRFRGIVLTASIMVVAIMITGIFVHLHPNVPAEVLPLKIKPPYIPGVFMLLATVNIFLLAHMTKDKSLT